jgi:hypothetical protein
MIYEDLKKIYGPYASRKDGRLRVVLVFIDGTKRTESYPKFLMERHLDRYLSIDETIGHIDGNPLNNNIDNLRVLPRRIHSYNDAQRNEGVVVRCSYCGNEFTISGDKLFGRNRADRKQSGYFCSRRCSGKYGKAIQMGLLDYKKVDRIVPRKYSKHQST